MAKNERRKSMPLDEAYFYLRRLELKVEKPTLFRVCNAIKTIDLAIETESVPGVRNLSLEAWSKIRNKLFHVLLTNFPGYFLVYDGENGSPLEPGQAWPERGAIEFYPEKILRRFETYKTSFDALDAETLTILRWCWGQDRQNVSPSTFRAAANGNSVPDEAQEVISFLERLYEICEEEAAEGKKIAHRKWWQLYWEANGCTDRRQRHELVKQMLSLQSVWGRPAQAV